MTPQREQKLQKVAAKRLFDLTVVLENVHDPHNVAAILRTCDAVGIAEVHVVNTILPWHKKGHKSSASAKNWIKVNYYRELEPCLTFLKTNGFSLIATHLDVNAENIFDRDLKEKLAFVFGNEHEGVSDNLLSQCDSSVIIPMNGMVQSLNVSVSAAICIYEAYRQRNLIDCDLSKYPENISLLDEWTNKDLIRSKKKPSKKKI